MRSKGNIRTQVALVVGALLTMSVILSSKLSSAKTNEEADTPRVVAAPRVNQAVATLEEAFESVADGVGKAVVTISVRRKAPEMQQMDPRRFQDEQEFFKNLPPGLREWFRDRGKGKSFQFRNPNGERQFELPQFSGTGSGFIFRNDGHILTNAHVVNGAEELGVRLSDGTVYKASVIGVDEIGDIAVIKIDSKQNLPVTLFGDSDRVRVGQYAIAVGTPMGFKGTVSVGIVSGINRSLGQRSEMIQTDAHITFGNSGGPLCNLKGEVIGINTMITREGMFGDANSGFGFAIPINEAKKVADQLISKGKVSRGYIGVWLKSELTPDEAEKLHVNRGVVIREVNPGTPGDKAGLKKNDVIQEVNGERVVSSEEVQGEVQKHTSGAGLKLGIVRDGKKMDVTVVLGELPAKVTPPQLEEEEQEKDKDQDQEKPSPREEKGPGPSKPEPPLKRGRPESTHLWNGMGVRELDNAARETYKLDKNENGALVTTIMDDSAAARAGLEVGDVVKDINRKPVQSAKDFERLSNEMGTDKPATLRVKRNNMTQLLTVKP